MSENKNIGIALSLSFLILIGSEPLLRYLRPSPPVLDTTKNSVVSVAPEAPSRLVIRDLEVSSVSAPVDRCQILDAEKDSRLKIQGPLLAGSLNLKGAFLDDLSLLNYRKTADPQSQPVVLMAPDGSFSPYRACFRWIVPQFNCVVPNDQTVWKVHGNQCLAPTMPLILQWDNGEGVLFEQIFEIDDQYMFTITQRVTNRTEKPLSFHTHGLIQRTGKPETAGLYILHEGPIGVLDGLLKELSYDSLKVGDNQIMGRGWLGLTDKYWLIALIPNVDQQITGNFSALGDKPIYQTDFYQTMPVVPAKGGVCQVQHRLFAGAKELKILDHYSQSLSIKNFDLAVDFGWFYPLTKPIFYALDWLNQVTGNFGVSLLLFTVLLKFLFFPLTNKSYRSMSRMRALQPEMTRLKEKFGHDKIRFNQEMMAIYQRAKINPVAGCLPMIMQIPVFFALYKVLYIHIDMRQAPFFGWIQDLSVPDPTTVWNLFGLLPWSAPEFLHIGAWPLLMGLTMFFQQKMNPPPADPLQAKMFLFVMPVVFTFMLANFPVGLVIYWAWSNVLSMGQQWLNMRFFQESLSDQVRKK